MLRRLLIVSLAGAAVGLAVPAPKDSWDPLRTLLSRWPYTDNFLVQVGNESGLVFQYQRGNMSADAHVLTASTSKWPSAMMLAGLVADGTIKSLDSKVHDYVPWWTKNFTDPRAHVTLRHLLSFTSGFGFGKPGNETEHGARCMGWHFNISFEECAQIVYDTTEMWGWPGTVYSYNSNHLKLAGVMAMHASGLSIQELITKYLVKGLRMPHTHCSVESNETGRGLVPDPNPDLAVCLNTTGADYGSFLAGVLRHEVLTPRVIEESEKDYTVGLMGEGYTLYGDYGFGHFLECFDSYQGFTEECKAARVHADPGAFGFYPLLDRRNKFWMTIVAFEHGASYPRSGIPEYLRVLAKPYVDLIIQGKDIGWNHEQLKTLSMDALDYINDCFFHPEHCL